MTQIGVPQLSGCSVAAASLLCVAIYLYPAPYATFDAHYPSSDAVSSSQPTHQSSDCSPIVEDEGRDPSLPHFRINEVRKHGRDSDNPWVIHGDKVYDITGYQHILAAKLAFELLEAPLILTIEQFGGHNGGVYLTKELPRSLEE
ncbi:hypothetical protein E4U40_005011 [Claviceps sp. LM458 group G5]|nr:hypothetical protein E4U40_005011 [Claviceps sp. LM458 group G5]